MTPERTPWQWYEVCLLALVIWREARGESLEARIMVGCSIRNRIDNPKWWGTDWISCITKKWQYSSMTASGDPQLAIYPQATDHTFQECLAVASMVHGRVYNSPLKGGDSYYDSGIAPPKWATPETFVGTLGRLHFHNLDRDIEKDFAHVSS